MVICPAVAPGTSMVPEQPEQLKRIGSVLTAATGFAAFADLVTFAGFETLERFDVESGFTELDLNAPVGLVDSVGGVVADFALCFSVSGGRLESS